MFKRSPGHNVPNGNQFASVSGGARVGQPMSILGQPSGYTPMAAPGSCGDFNNFGDRTTAVGADPNPSLAIAQPCNVGQLPFTITNTTNLTATQVVGTPGLFFVLTYSPDTSFEVCGLYIDPQMADEFSVAGIFQTSFTSNLLGSNGGFIPGRWYSSWDTCCCILQLPYCVSKQAPLVVVVRGNGGVASFNMATHTAMIGRYKKCG